MIPKEFTKTSKINSRLNKIIEANLDYWDVDDIRWDICEFEIETNEETGNPFRYDIAEAFDEEYTLFVSQNKYFFGCPFSIYYETYSNRLDIYLEENKLDLFTEAHFINVELKTLEENIITHYLNYKTKQKLSASLERQKEFLLEKTKTLKTIPLVVNQNIVNEQNSKKKLDTNPYPRIFISLNSFFLFEAFKEHIRDKNLLADYSFIYRKMQADSFIYEAIGDSEFRNFLYDNLNIDIEKTKQLNNCSTVSKENTYSSLKDLIKL